MRFKWTRWIIQNRNFELKKFSYVIFFFSERSLIEQQSVEFDLHKECRNVYE